MGRLTKWKPEINKRLVKFFDIPPYREIEIPHYKKGEIDWIDKKLVPNKTPWMHRFEMQEGLSDGLISRWVSDEKSEEKYPGLVQAYNQAKKLYKEFLVENALNGLYPPATFIFTAKNTTDMRDAVLNEITGKDGGEIIVKWEK